MVEIERKIIDFIGRVLTVINSATIVLAWVYVSFYYPSLPDIVPTVLT